MATRKRAKKQIWRTQAKRVLHKSGKLVKRFQRRLVKFIKERWKAKRRKRRSSKARIATVVRQPAVGLLVGLGLSLGILYMAGRHTQQPPPCVLTHQVNDPGIQQQWAEVRQWCWLISQSGAAYHLDPNLIAAIIWVESRGDPNAYSYSGAVGLMQVMPRDGRAASFWCPNGPCFAGRPTILELQDPAFNVNYGSRLLASNLEEYGSLREAVREYGPKDVGYSYADYVLWVYGTIKS